MNKKRVSDIKKRLEGVSGKPWKYNPEHEMFIGTTNALEMYHGTLDLGRNHKEWYPYQDENMKGYRRTKASLENESRIKALGEFLEYCREDIQYLLDLIG